MIQKNYTRGNADNIQVAINGLNTFTHNYCMDCEETTRKNEPIYRCDGCEFSKGKECMIHTFAANRGMTVGAN